MRWLLIVLTLCVAAWIGLFYTKTGVLISSRDYMVSDADAVEFDPTTGATDAPMGRACEYLTFAGMKRLVMINRGEWETIQREKENGARTDPALENAIIVENWRASPCPVMRSFHGVAP